MLGACCTLVISHQQNMTGKTYASIDAVSKPTKKVTASGTYDTAAARQRFAEWKAKQGGKPQAAAPVAMPHATAMQAGPVSASAPAKSNAATTPPAADYDPEVGF